MNKKVLWILCVFVGILGFSGCKKNIEYSITYNLLDGVLPEGAIVSFSEKDETVLPIPSKSDYSFDGWYQNSEFTGEKVTKIPVGTKENQVFFAKWIRNPFTSFSLTGKTTMSEGSSQIIQCVFEEGSLKPELVWETSNESIIELGQKKTSGIKIDARHAGDCVIKATSKSDESIYASIAIRVTGANYNISYILTDEDKSLMPEEYPNSYNTGDDKTVLPVLTKENFIFLGWATQTALYPDYYFEISKMEGDLELTPIWSYPHLEVSYETTSITSVDSTLQLLLKKVSIPDELSHSLVVWSSSDESIAVVDDLGVVMGIKEGYVEIMVKLKDKASINMTVGVTISNEVNKLNEALQWFYDNQVKEVLTKRIQAFGDLFNYYYDCVGSVCSYLFEPLEITEMLAPLTAPEGKILNRPGTISPKYYICIHDTGETKESATAKFWAEEISMQQREASWHYTVGNDGIYHQIPDNEVAYHAGDGTRNPYKLIATGVKATLNKKGVVTIIDGYYAVNGTKTTVAAPTKSSSNPSDAKIYNCTTEDINDLGILCKIVDGEYYLGNTYFNYDYRKIANRGGNNNSIGIETCVTAGTDLHYTWQKCAKLVAVLMKKFKLTTSDIVQHHYFSGKNCPMTIRTASLWEYFINLCQKEYEVLTKFSDYTITFESLDKEYINDLGRVVKWPTYSKTVSYKITCQKGDLKQSITLQSVIPGKVLITSK